jgi:putative ABC transport system substrate-binding protein
MEEAMNQIGRRRFLTAAGALLAAPHVSRASTSTKLPVLGFLNPGSKVSPKSLQKWRFFTRLQELGWVEGKTLRVEYAFADWKMNRLPDLAAMLVEKEVDVIWTASPWGAIAAAKATTTIPIVFWRVGFPERLGIVRSLAHPGGNVTGLAWVSDGSVYVKRYELLRELAPHAARVATLTAASTFRDISGTVVDMSWLGEKMAAAVRELQFEGKTFHVRKRTDFESAFAAMEHWAPDSIVVHDVPLTIGARKQIVEFARRQRLVDAYMTQKWAEAGGLMSYGIVLDPTLVRTAEMVDRVLRGTKPAEMPVELPSEYEIVVNLATAKAQGFVVPTSFLLRVDRMIE